MLTGCGGKSGPYTTDGQVTLKDAEGEHLVQIAEFLENEDGLTVFVKGSKDFTICTTQITANGLTGYVAVNLEMIDADGNAIQADRVIPYITGEDSGGLVSYTFANADKSTYETMQMSMREVLDGKVQIPISEINPPEKMKVSDTIIQTN